MNENEYIKSGIIEQYVLGLCSPEEKSAIELLRQKDVGFNEAIGQFEIQLEREMMSHGVLPDIETDHRILETLNTLNQAPVVSFKNESRNHNNTNKLKFFAAAASILLVFSAGYNFVLYTKYKAQQSAFLAGNSNTKSSLPLSDYNILKNPAITPIAMYGVGYHAICRCTMFWDKKTGKVYVMIHHLVLSDDKRDYQLWANVNGKPISVGIIDDAIRDRFIELKNMPAGATSFSVTLEKAGGADKPTEAETYLKGEI